MTAETENSILEHLRTIGRDVSDIKERVGRLERRLSAIEGTMDGALSDSDHETVQWFIKRMVHINGVRN
jgi:hypothetical protein